MLIQFSIFTVESYLFYSLLSLSTAVVSLAWMACCSWNPGCSRIFQLLTI